MEKVYFIYTLNFISGVGGVAPELRDESIETGLSNHNGYFLGSTTDINKLNMMREFSPTIIDADTAAGFMLLETDAHYTYEPTIQDIMEDIEGVPTKVGETTVNTPVVTPLTEAETTQKAKAQKLITKMGVRVAIEQSVGDTNDLVADLSKRVSMLERALVALFMHEIDGTEIPEPYKTLVRQIHADIASGALVTDTDKSPDNMFQIYNKLKERQVAIADELGNYYTT